MSPFQQGHRQLGVIGRLLPAQPWKGCSRPCGFCLVFKLFSSCGSVERCEIDKGCLPQHWEAHGAEEGRGEAAGGRGVHSTRTQRSEAEGPSPPRREFKTNLDYTKSEIDIEIHRVVLTENLDHNLPDRTKQTCPLHCPCVYWRGRQVLWLPKCLSVLNTGPDRGKSKNKLAIWEGGEFRVAGRNVP